MKFRSSVFLSLISVMTFGCGETNKAGGGGNNFGLAGDFAPQGKFTQITAPAGDSPYMAGCKAPGQYESVAQIDKKLKVGDVLTSAYRYSAGGLNLAMTMSQTIKAVSSAALDYRLSFDALSGFSKIKSGDSADYSCTMKGESLSCVESPTYVIPSSFMSCAGDVAPSAAAFEPIEGTFLMKSGKVVRARMLKGSTPMTNLSCSHQAEDGTIGESVKVGDGRSEIVFIFSNDVPTTSAYFCGGAAVFGSFTYYDSKGKLVSGTSLENLSF